FRYSFRHARHLLRSFLCYPLEKGTKNCITKPLMSRTSCAGPRFTRPLMVGVKSQSRITMGRRYRRRNSLGSVMVDIVRIASRHPWWVAFLVGLMGPLATHVGLCDYLDGQIHVQDSS